MEAGGQVPKESWKEKLAKHWYELKLADTGVQIQKDIRRQATIERLIKKTQDGTLGKGTSEPMDRELEDEMSVNVGNTTNYYPLPAPAPPPPSIASGIAKTLAAVGISGALMGAGVSLPVIAYNLTKPSVAAQDEPVNDKEDRDTKYNLKIYRDE